MRSLCAQCITYVGELAQMQLVADKSVWHSDLCLLFSANACAKCNVWAAHQIQHSDSLSVYMGDKLN